MVVEAQVLAVLLNNNTAAMMRAVDSKQKIRQADRHTDIPKSGNGSCEVSER